MFGCFLKFFIVLLSFSRSLAFKFIWLNNEQRKTRPFILDLNPAELKAKYLKKIESQNKTEKVNLNIFNFITRASESKCKC